MAYDPQARQKRPRPTAEDAAPVEAFLPGIPRLPPTELPPTELPLGVTPDPADPPSDQLLVRTGLAAACGGLASLLALAYLWHLRTRRSPRSR